jgi:ubiquitin carboxyl-terminal hydrolase 9/13
LFYQAVDLTTSSLNISTSADGLNGSSNNHFPYNQSQQHNGPPHINGNGTHRPMLPNGISSSPAINRSLPSGLDSNAAGNSNFQPATTISTGALPTSPRNLDASFSTSTTSSSSSYSNPMDSSSNNINNNGSIPPTTTPSRTRTWGLGRKIREKREKR